MADSWSLSHMPWGARRPSCLERTDGARFPQTTLRCFKHLPKYSSNSQPEPGPPAPDKAITKPNSNLHLNQNLKPSPESAPKPQKRSDTNGAGEKHTGIQIEARPGMTFLGLGFSSVDMSLCVLLYALSCVFLMFMFFFFHFRSKRWKTRNYRPYV